MPLIRQFYLKNGRFSPAMIRGMAGYFHISMPDEQRDDVLFTKVGDFNLKLNDPGSVQLYNNKMRLGAAESIRQQIAHYFLPDASAAEIEELTAASLLAHPNLN
jgi:hypothetical protein